MVHKSVRFSAWMRWFRRQELFGAVVAALFVALLLGLGLYAIVTMHGFHLAGG